MLDRVEIELNILFNKPINLQIMHFLGQFIKIGYSNTFVYLFTNHIIKSEQIYITPYFFKLNSSFLI